MTLSVWLEQAKDGDAAAIAALLNQSLKPQGIEVRAEREGYCLNLWLTGATLPPQAQLMDYLRRTIERWQLDCIGILRIDAEATANPSQSWALEMAMLAGLVQVPPHLPEAPFSQADTPSLQTTLQASPQVASPKATVRETPRHDATHDSAKDAITDWSLDLSDLPITETASGPLETDRRPIPPSQTESLPPNVARAYQELRLSPGASLPEVESTYFKTKAALLRQGRRAEVEPLKWAFGTLKDYLENPPSAPPTSLTASLPDDQAHGFSDVEETGAHLPDSPALTSSTNGSHGTYSAEPSLSDEANPAMVIQTLLQGRGLPAQVSRQENQLHIRWPAARVANPKQATVQVYALLTQQDLVALGLGEVKTLVITALDGRNQAVWRQTLTLPQRPTVEEDTDLSSFNNRYSNGIIFPALLVIGMILNAMPIANLLLRGIKIWIHEFGHAVVAWLAGRQAIPLPIGWTNVNPQRSFFVYLGVLILLGLLYWSGQREKKRWPMVLAVGLALLQFAMTWLMSANTFDMLLAFGGIGGELYLSTLLMVSFFFPMPAYWRWDLYRYPVVLGAAFTFWGQFWLWKAIRMGRASIPFGMMWGDAEHGDMNILVNRHQWEPGTLISTYNTIANLCFLALLGVYAYALYRQHRHRVWIFYQRWIS